MKEISQAFMLACSHNQLQIFLVVVMAEPAAGSAVGLA